MKIVLSVQNLYNSKFHQYNNLKERIDRIFLVNKPSGWHYLGRLKTPESFALKIETGRFSSEEIFEDYFGCTLVVENLTQIENALAFVKQYCLVAKQKPPSGSFTYKDSFSFPFDDLRLYCTYKDPGTEEISNDILELVFEVQIKTFLQHAWAIATHDLIYKSDIIKWSKERIAYQLRAALEHAEETILSVESLSQIKELQKDNKIIKQINQVIRILNRRWSSSELPADKRRLAQNIIQLFKCLELPISELESILDKETQDGQGTNIKNLSPYLIIVKSIFNQKSAHALKILRSQKACESKILITRELELPVFSHIKREKIVDLRGW